MVHAVSNQVHQGIIQLIYDCFVEFGLASLDHQIDVLAKIPGQVMHESTKSFERAPDRQHSDAHGIFTER